MSSGTYQQLLFWTWFRGLIAVLVAFDSQARSEFHPFLSKLSCNKNKISVTVLYRSYNEVPQWVLRIACDLFTVDSQELVSLEHFIDRDDNEGLGLLEQFVVLVDLAYQCVISGTIRGSHASIPYLQVVLRVRYLDEILVEVNHVVPRRSNPRVEWRELVLLLVQTAVEHSLQQLWQHDQISPHLHRGL